MLGHRRREDDQRRHLGRRTSCDAATAISGPAWRNSTASASRVIAEPTVFVTAMIGQPRSRASRVGAIVSAVSPDWVTAMTSVRSSSGGGL